jgi:hypothetical protein
LYWFPAVGIDKIYDYRGKVGRDWKSFGGLGLNDRALSIAWNAMNPEKPEFVTSGVPRNPVLDEEAVRKWRETNPAEDEEMVDIVHQRPSPLAEGLAERAQLQLHRGRTQLPAVRCIERPTEVIKDFQEEEESSDIEMREEAEEE